MPHDRLGSALGSRRLRGRVSPGPAQPPAGTEPAPLPPGAPMCRTRTRVDGREDHRRARRTGPHGRRSSLSLAEDRAARAQEDRRLMARYHRRGRSGRAGAARRALPAARAPARAALPARRRAARRPRPGRLARAAEGDRPLRPRARDRVLVVRRPDHPRRAQAALPRQGLVRSCPARSAGAGRQGRPGGRRDVARAGPRPDAGRDRRADRHHARSRCSRRARPRPPTARSRSTARAPTRRRRATPTPTRSARRTPATAIAEDAATVERLMQVLSEREREVLRLRFEEDLTQSEIGAPRRRLPDARLAPDPAVDRAPARRGRRTLRRAGTSSSGHGALGPPHARRAAAPAADPALVARRVAHDRHPPAGGRGAAGPRGARARASRRRRRRGGGRGRRRHRARRARVRSRSSIRTSATRCAPTRTRACCSCSPRGPAQGHPGARDA